MSIKEEMLLAAQTMAGLLATGDAADIPSARRQLKRLTDRISSLHDIVDEIITIDDPWNIELKAGTCFGGRYVIKERMDPKKHIHLCSQRLFEDEHGVIAHDVVVKCTFTDSMGPEGAHIVHEHERRSIQAVGLDANDTPYSVELIDAGKVTTPEGVVVFYWQAFEIMAGDAKNLSKIMEGGIPPFIILRLAAQIAEALVNYHTLGVVHRDVKPHNILFAWPSNELFGAIRRLLINFKLTDAQLAMGTAADASVTIAGSLLGTPRYMSPEQIRDPHNVSIQTDVWSLAISLYELITGESPHNFGETEGSQSASLTATSLSTYLQAILEGTPKLFSAHPKAADYSAFFVDLMDRSLNKNPHERPTSLEWLLALQIAGNPMPTDFVKAPSFLEQTLCVPPSEERRED